MLSMMFVMLPRAAASAARINEVLDDEAGDHGCHQAPQHAGRDCAAMSNSDDVTFSYPGAEEPALSNISFSASPAR